MTTSSVIYGFQDTYGWNDDTVLSLLMEFCDKHGMANDLVIFLEDRAELEKTDIEEDNEEDNEDEE